MLVTNAECIFFRRDAAFGQRGSEFLFSRTPPWRKTPAPMGGNLRAGINSG